MSGPDRSRAVSSVIGDVLLVAIVVILGATISVVALGFAEEARDPGPQVGVESTFLASDTVDPHWQFNITHVAGDTIDPGELKIRLTDDYGGGNRAEVVYPETFTAGDTIRVGLWGSPNRADDGTCLVAPDGESNDQLDGFGDSRYATEVAIDVIHKPSNTLMDTVTIDLSEMPRRFDGDERHFLIDGVRPSIGCEAVPEDEW